MTNTTGPLDLIGSRRRQASPGSTGSSETSKSSAAVTELRKNPSKKKIGSRGTVVSFDVGPKRPLYAHLEPLWFEDDFGDLMEFVDYPAIAKDFCVKTISGAWPACGYVKMACRRYLTMLEMAAEGVYGFTFSEAHACDFLAFTEDLPLAQDNFRGVTKTELEPWQIFIGCALYGFRDAMGFRYIRECYIEIPRKQSKSVIATAIGLYDVRQEQSTAPLVLIAASTLEQADRVFGPMKTIIDRDDELRSLYKLNATKLEIKCETNGGEVQKVASIGKRQDGWNPTTIILEELHAQNPDVYAVLKSAMGSRGGQLLFQITTAGRDAFGLAWDNRKAAIRVLEGHEEDWQVFAVIYTLDKADLEDENGHKNYERALTDERLWIKACPNLGVSFDIAAFHMLARSAKNKPQEREEFYRTRVNIWTNSATRMIDPESLRRGIDETLKIENFKGRRAWLGLDMSTADDLSALVAILELDEDTLLVFAKHYAAATAPIFTDPDYMGMCRHWADVGLIDTSREDRVNHSQIETDIRLWCSILDVQLIGCDPAMAGIIMDNLENSRLPVIKFVNQSHMMTAPVDDLVSRANAESRCYIRFDGNPVWLWCMSNAHGEKKKDGTIMFFKDSQSSLSKIDGAVAAAIANGCRLNPAFADKTKKPSVFERRGLLGFDQ